MNEFATESSAPGPDLPIGVSDWERVSALTELGRYRSLSKSRALDVAAALVGTCGQALDIGCGEGRWAMELRDRGWRVIAADVVERLLAVCAWRIPDARLCLVSPTSTQLPATDASIRLLLAFEVPAVTQALWFPSEARRVLEPCGALVFTYHNPCSWRGLIARPRFLLDPRRRGLSYRGSSYRRFRKQLRLQGFRLVHQEGIGWIPFTVRSDSSFVPPFAAIERALGMRRLVTFSPTVVGVALLDASR
jgi:SAM-dependent methyltransferase